jgi:hypothetical protein
MVRHNDVKRQMQCISTPLAEITVEHAMVRKNTI